MMNLATLTIQIAIIAYLAWGGVLSLAYLFQRGMRDFPTAD
jgi:hypothetical protein